jgi:hypothetical protein
MRDGHQRTNDADFIAAARTDVPALLAEVERLTRIVNGYDRSPAEQAAARLAQARNVLADEVDRLTEENANAWAEGHKHPWRRDASDCHCGAWSSIECGCGRYGTGALLSLADNPYQPPQDAPRAANGAGVALGDDAQAGDAAEFGEPTEILDRYIAEHDPSEWS